MARANPQEDDDLRDFLEQMDAIRAQPPQQPSTGNPNVDDALGQHFQQLALRPPPPQQRGGAGPTAQIARPRPRPSSNQPGPTAQIQPPSRPIPVARPQPTFYPPRPRSPKVNYAREGGTKRASRSWKETERLGGYLPGDCTHQTSRFDNPEMTPFNPNLGEDIAATLDECQQNPEYPGRSTDRRQQMYAISQICKLNGKGRN